MLRWLTRSPALTRRCVAAAIIAVMLTGCGGDQDSGVGQQLTVFAASSLTEAFTEVAAAFQDEYPGSSVVLNFDGSQRLRFQLEHGAGADVFASADQRQMQLAQDAGLLAGDAVNFASNQLVIVVPKSESAAKTANGDGPLVESAADLSRKGVKLALAQAEVPAGSYARAVIQRMSQDPSLGPGYAASVLANLVTDEPNVRNVLQKVALGEVDAGFVYYSDAQVVPNVSVIQVPDQASVEAAYTIAVLEDSGQPDGAQDFVGFILSGPGQEILRSHGFGAPTGESNAGVFNPRHAAAVNAGPLAGIQMGGAVK